MTGNPLLRMVALVGCGTRPLLGAVFGPDTTGELGWRASAYRTRMARHASFAASRGRAEGRPADGDKHGSVIMELRRAVTPEILCLRCPHG